MTCSCFSVSRNSSAFPQQLKHRVAGCWGLGVCRGRLCRWGTGSISKGTLKAAYAWKKNKHRSTETRSELKILFVLLQSYGSEGLQLMEHAEIVLSGQAVLQLTFDPGTFGYIPLTTRCQLDHPFYVKNKGMSEVSEALGAIKHSCLYTHFLVLSVRLVVLLPELDCGALWDTVLRNGSGRHVPASGTQRRQACGRFTGVWHVQKVKWTPAVWSLITAFTENTSVFKGKELHVCKLVFKQ